MALHRGIQSAIFYYLSCAPCAEARYRKKRKREAVLDRADREALEAEMPDLYRHPSPSSTNPYWGSEIAAGPVLSSRGRRKGGGGYSQANDSQGRLKTSTTQRSTGSSADLGSRGVVSRDSPRVSGQRPSEEAWAMMGSTERLPSRSTTMSASTYDGGGGITRPPRAMTRDNIPGASYTSFSNPHVNDLVPAIATQVNSREEAAALMLGPPNPEYMAGRGPGAARSRSTSGGSSQLTVRSIGVPLSREVSRRMIERKLQSGETMSRQSSARTVEDLQGQPHDRTRTEAKDSAPQLDDSPPFASERRRASPHESQQSEDSTGTVLHEPLLAPEPVHRHPSTRAATRPQLSTIVSSDNVTNSDGTTTTSSLGTPALVPKENGLPPPILLRNNHSDTSIRDSRDRTQRRSPITDHSVGSAPWTPPSQMQILHGRKPSPPSQHPDTPILNTQIFASARGRQGSVDLSDDNGGGGGTGGPGQLQGAGGLFDTWYTPDFALPDWVHEHTKREVSQRWSMDI